jgi:hypothetical protein
VVQPAPGLRPQPHGARLRGLHGGPSAPGSSSAGAGPGSPWA